MSLPLFSLGELAATPDSLETLEAAGQDPQALVRRHLSGDWGDLSENDKQANDQALKDGSRIFSAYKLAATGEKVWIITEADRSRTCILRPDEY